MAHSSFGSQDKPLVSHLSSPRRRLGSVEEDRPPSRGSATSEVLRRPEKSNWESATVTTLDEKILPTSEAICKRDPLSGGVVTGGIVSVKDSSWLLSEVSTASRSSRPARGQVCVWLYSLFTDVPGDYVKKPMRDCTGKEICESGCTTWVPEEQIEELAEVFREHGALHDALHHGLLHAPRRWRPSARRA